MSIIDNSELCSIILFIFFRGIFQTIPSYGADATYSKTFQEGVHTIEYKAVDESGNFDSCQFLVIVKGTWLSV